MEIDIFKSQEIPLKYRNIEIVEKKGQGHPDTICDSLMDSMSVALCKAYKEKFGVILHHNLDKCLLTAGRSEPKFSGGKIIFPMSIFMGDRATVAVGDKFLDIDKIFIENGKDWFRRNLRYVDVNTGVKFHPVFQPGSQNLVDNFNRKTTKYLGANDTSATVGYYPFTPTERVVKSLENCLNSYSFHKNYPEAGEDVKIMVYRNKDKLDLTVAIAFVDTFIKNEQDYFAKKQEIELEIKGFVSTYSDLEVNNLYLNALDRKGGGTDGLYLTVSGTSGESGDSGQVGRGNDPSGIIPLCRPMASEAAPGKNPVSHVGKIYNALCFKIAKDIYYRLGVDDIYVWLVSRIGKPINEPAVVSVQLHNGLVPTEIQTNEREIIENVVDQNFEHLDEFCVKLSEGKIKLW